MKEINYENYTNWDKIIEQSKSWPIDEQVRLGGWCKQGLTGLISKNGIRYITKADWQRFLKGKEPFNEYEKN